MARILTRPMFKKGGLSRETGIMSGLDSPRRNYAGGGNIGGGQFAGTPMGSRTGFQTTTGPQIPPISDLDKWKQRIRGTSGGIWDAIKKKLGTTTTQSGSQIASNAAKKVSKWSKAKDLLKSPKFSERGLYEAIKKYGPKALNIGKTGIIGAASRFPLLTTAATIYGAGTSTPVDEKYGITRMDNLFPMFGDTKETMMKKFKRNQEEASNPNNPWRYDEGLTGIPRKEHPLYDPEKSSWFPWSKGAAETKLEGDEVKDPEIPITESDIDTKVTGDVESDLMRAYKEYAPIFEKELGVSPEDTKKQLWMQLAKFGTGLMAQPGGDLVGAVGKAAEKPLEGAGEVVKEVSTAKRQAKLLALQTAIREGEPGQIGKAVKDIAKIYKVSQEEAAAIYEKWNRNDSTARAAANARYAEQAEKLGLVKDNQNRFIAEANEIANKHPELIGQFNNKLPEDPDDWEVGGYYVTDTGRLIRVVEQEGKKVRIGMDETGFSDKKKNKK